VNKIFTTFAISIFIAAMTVSLSFATEDEPAVRQALSKFQPNLNVGEVRKTDIPGLYELEVGPNIIYFYPDKGLILFGEIWTKDGKSLTAARREQLAAKRVKDIPLDKGVRIGSGPNTVVEFTDPDCPFCRKASEYLKGRNDTTRYVFFFPLPVHKDAENKARLILCSKDKEKTYKEVMSGTYDERKVEPCPDEKVSALLKEHREIAAKAGVTGTPAFWINGSFVMGANLPAMERIFKNQNNATDKEKELWNS
jgi:thiol:disulfide interchange protein DsbC